MSKRTAKQTSLDNFTNIKCSFKFKTEWLSELVETELPTSAGNRMTKLVDIFIFRNSTDYVDCQLCYCVVCRQAVGEFRTGKRWADWKMD